MTKARKDESRKKGETSKESGRSRREHTDEFKREAIRLLRDRQAAGVSLAHVARELQVRADLLRRWVRLATAEAAASAQADKTETPQQELRRLRREVATLRQEQEFAKTVAVYFAKESR
jgi:transposase